jgi:hypothetical protein
MANLKRSAGTGCVEPPACRLTVVNRPIGALTLDPKNPRLHSHQQIRQIAHSIEAFGFNVPILIDGQLKVIAGHGRVLACRQLGWSEVPTISLDHLSEAQKQAFMIADNRLTETSIWNEQLLAEQLKELSVLNLDFSLEATGFEMGEIDMHIESPYNVPIDGHASGLGHIRHRDFVMACGEMDETQFIDFLTRSFTLLARHSIDGAIHFTCMDWRHAAELMAAGRNVYTELKNICIWVKHNAGMGSFYRSQFELVFVFKHGRGSHRNNVQLGRHGRHRPNVWSYRGANSFGRGTDEGNLLELHPTVKPVAMVADAILDCSARGEVVLDGFLGSGTTIIAAERTGRRCYGLEIDPVYVDTIIRRWQAFTGDSARHAATGRSFTSLEADAEEHHGQ